jgi:RNA polymerase subunit RPABC4/transcription elongation factor Spt4
MTCARCRRKYGQDSATCPNCGEPNPETSGVMQTSIVVISAGNEDLVYRTVDEVPSRLRTKLLRSTNGSNSATILIADRRGRKQVARALRSLPGPAQRRLMHNVIGRRSAAERLTPARKRAAVALLLLLALLAVIAVFRLHN